MKTTINKYTAITSQDGIIAVANVDEVMNVRTGDIDEVMSIKFFSKNLLEIGYAKVTNSGNHCYMSGDFHGGRLAKKLGFASANA